MIFSIKCVHYNLCVSSSLRKDFYKAGKISINSKHEISGGLAYESKSKEFFMCNLVEKCKREMV